MYSKKMCIIKIILSCNNKIKQNHRQKYLLNTIFKILLLRYLFINYIYTLTLEISNNNLTQNIQITQSHYVTLLLK